MTSKEAKERFAVKGHYLTVGQLKKELDRYPDDALVVSQRVEDKYYNTPDNGWNTIKKPDGLYPDMDNEYSPVWCVCHYMDDKDCVYLDLHY
jgi:hypothetical protein